MQFALRFLVLVGRRQMKNKKSSFDHLKSKTLTGCVGNIAEGDHIMEVSRDVRQK
jgi:hypothetical protein